MTTRNHRPANPTTCAAIDHTLPTVRVYVTRTGTGQWFVCQGDRAERGLPAAALAGLHRVLTGAEHRSTEGLRWC